MDKIYHGCFYKNADGTNKVIAAGELCLTPTKKCFWKDPSHVKNGVKTRSLLTSSQLLAFEPLTSTGKRKVIKQLIFM